MPCFVRGMSEWLVTSYRSIYDIETHQECRSEKLCVKKSNFLHRPQK